MDKFYCTVWSLTVVHLASVCYHVSIAQLVQISSANEEKRTELQCKLMELERSHSQLQEEAEHKMAALQEQHNQAMGELVARYARHNLHTDVVRLQSRLEAKEVSVVW